MVCYNHVPHSFMITDMRLHDVNYLRLNLLQLKRTREHCGFCSIVEVQALFSVAFGSVTLNDNKCMSSDH